MYRHISDVIVKKIAEFGNSQKKILFTFLLIKYYNIEFDFIYKRRNLYINK